MEVLLVISDATRPCKRLTALEVVSGVETRGKRKIERGTGKGGLSQVMAALLL